MFWSFNLYQAIQRLWEVPIGAREPSEVKTPEIPRRRATSKIADASSCVNPVAYHHHSTDHQIDFNNVQIITEEKNYWRRLIIEGMEIKRLAAEQRANLQLGYEIHECWEPILNKL